MSAMAERRSSKERVMAKWPEARAVQDYVSGYWRIRNGYAPVHLDYQPTARQDAASRLPTKGK